MPRPIRVPVQVTLDGNGDGAATFTAREAMTVLHTRVQVAQVLVDGRLRTVRQARAVLYVQGMEFESSFSGSGDSSDTAYDLDPADTVECRWTGGDPGQTATLTVRGKGAA